MEVVKEERKWCRDFGVFEEMLTACGFMVVVVPHSMDFKHPSLTNKLAVATNAE